MKLLLLGDVHGELEENRIKVKQLLELNKREVDFVIQAGDLGFYEPMPISSYFIFGNNEDFDVIQSMLDGEVEYENLKLIKSGEIIKLRKGRSSLMLSGLCGNYAPKYFNFKREELVGDRRRHFVAEEVQRCLSLSNIDLFLSHEAPYGLIRRRGYDLGVRHITDILKTVKPRYLFSGHHHEFAYRRIEKSQCYSLAPAVEEYLIYDSKSDVIKKYDINGREITIKQTKLSDF
ncbi:MAG: metallophosphoesterase [Methanocellales archaeon]